MRRALLTGLALATLASQPAVAADTITFGASLQLTGKDANVGRYYKDAYQLAVDQINSKGGLTVAGKTYTLALDILDNQSDITLSVQQYVQLLTQNKVSFLLGPYASAMALNDSAIAEKYEVPMVEGGGASGQIFSRGFKYIFGTLAPAEDYYASTIHMLAKLDPKVKTVALVSADDAFNVSLAKGTRELLKKAGLAIVVDEQYGAKTSDFSSILALIKSKAPDAVLWGGLETSIVDAVRQSKSLNVNPADMISFTVGVPTADFRKALGKDADTAFGMTAWLPSPPHKDEWFGDSEAFDKAYVAKFGYEPDYHPAAGAAAVEVFAKAIVAAGTLDPHKVRDAIAALDFESLYGHIHFGDTGQISLAQTVIQIQDGKLVPIFTDHFVNKPIYPVPAWDKR
jgi:branched-chain amino acid transport system substrate-binding protein